ncbi:hypothetical protein PG999_001583 [Apiospora kogelbergensis]|uniref:Protein kinase domain-containing protein n=1 Tax=Apiospora kogelbergensis TaxID=1337665 RepID=A0AAW0R5X7_9PEZI
MQAVHRCKVSLAKPPKLETPDGHSKPPSSEAGTFRCTTGAATPGVSIRPQTGIMSRIAHDVWESPITPRSNYQFEYPLGVNEPKANSTDGSHDGSTSHKHSCTLTSDGGSSVTTVSDLGLDAAPSPFSQQKCTCGLGGSHLDDLFGHYMSPEELREHLHLPPDLKLSTTGTVRQELERLTLCSEPRHNVYLPLDAFEALFCKQSIKSLLKESSAKGLPADELMRKVLRIHQIDVAESRPSRRRILAVLTMMDRVKYIDQFIRNDVWDTDLPIEPSKMRFGDIFRHWDGNDRILFGEYQNRISIPFFDFRHDKLPSYPFSKDIRLPWLEYKRMSVGGTGMVHKIKIHPSHHNFNQRGSQYFALKEIQTQDTMSYKNELGALEQALGRTQSEKHLIKLLLTFQHGNRCYLVFDWADGNLQEFWDQRTITTSHFNNVWITKQCYGLATALKRIHGLATFQKEERKRNHSIEANDYREYGRHGDIKAANILWFKDYQGNRDHFVLADLGLTRYHSNLTRSQVRYSDLDGWTDQYRAPELDLRANNISQKYDIWSLGCVFLELFIWYALGADGISDFEDQLDTETKGDATNFGEANFFNIHKDGHGNKSAVVKPAVEKWIEKIKSLDCCPDFLRDMLDLINNHMLVICPEDRHEIDWICIDISRILLSLPTNKDTDMRSSTKPSCTNTPESTVRVQIPSNTYMQSASPRLLGIGGDQNQHLPDTLDEQDVILGEGSSSRSQPSHHASPEVFEALERVNKSFPYVGYRRKAKQNEDNTSTDNIDIDDIGINAPQRALTLPAPDLPSEWK